MVLTLISKTDQRSLQIHESAKLTTNYTHTSIEPNEISWARHAHTHTHIHTPGTRLFIPIQDTKPIYNRHTSPNIPMTIATPLCHVCHLILQRSDLGSAAVAVARKFPFLWANDTPGFGMRIGVSFATVSGGDATCVRAMSKTPEVSISIGSQKNTQRKRHPKEFHGFFFVFPWFWDLFWPDSFGCPFLWVLFWFLK